MTNEQLLDRVTSDSDVCHGQPCRAADTRAHRLASVAGAGRIVVRPDDGGFDPDGQSSPSSLSSPARPAPGGA